MNTSMEKGEAEFYFHEADRLFKEGHFLEALQHLAALDSEFPDTFNILFPMALCCEQLGRVDEAYERCARMFEQFPEEKHQGKLRELFQRVCRRQQAAMGTGAQIPAPFPAHEFIEDPPQHTELNRTGTMALGNWTIPWLGILVGGFILVAFFVLLAVLIPIIRGWEAEENPNALYLGTALIFIAQFMLSCFIAYAVLWVMNKLIHEELLRDIIDVCIAMVIFTLISSFLPVIGFFVGMYYFAKHYGMGFSEAIIFLLLQSAFNMLFLYMMLPLVFGESALHLLQVL